MTSAKHILLYLKEVVNIVKVGCCDNLMGLYLYGSLAFSDMQEMSDIDLLCIVNKPLTTKAKKFLEENLSHNSLPCPLSGLELVVITYDEVSNFKERITYDFSLSTGDKWDLEVSHGDNEEEFLIDLAVARQSSIILTGSPAKDLIGTVDRTRLLYALIKTLVWHKDNIHHLFHDPFGHLAVLNACRAYCYYVTNKLVSKTAGGAWALDNYQNLAIINDAMAIRLGKRTYQLNKEEVINFLDNIIQKIKV